MERAWLHFKVWVKIEEDLSRVAAENKKASPPDGRGKRGKESHFKKIVSWWRGTKSSAKIARSRESPTSWQSQDADEPLR
jgi:hypothetical protein